MQYSDSSAENEWRNNFHARQLSADTVFGATGLFYGAATTSRVVTALPPGALMPWLTISLLAISQWIVLMMLFGTLIQRQWYMNRRRKIIWFMSVMLTCLVAYWTPLAHPIEPSSSLLWTFIKVWCGQGRWFVLAFVAYGVRQPLDDHMTSNFPGILSAVGMNTHTCNTLARSPEFKSCFHAVYRAWRFLCNPSATSLEHLVHHSRAPTLEGFSDLRSSAVCQSTFATSQLLLAFAWPCLLVFKREWRDRMLNLERRELTGRGIRIQFNRMYDVVAIMLLEAAVFFVVFE